MGCLLGILFAALPLSYGVVSLNRFIERKQPQAAVREARQAHQAARALERFRGRLAEVQKESGSNCIVYAGLSKNFLELQVNQEWYHAPKRQKERLVEAVMDAWRSCMNQAGLPAGHRQERVWLQDASGNHVGGWDPRFGTRVQP